MRREKLEQIVTIAMNEGKRSRRNQRGVTKWLKVGRATGALKATRDRDAW